eukprot:1179480-Prorocentrum_minimum.AAC.4
MNETPTIYVTLVRIRWIAWSSGELGPLSCQRQLHRGCCMLRRQRCEAEGVDSPAEGVDSPAKGVDSPGGALRSGLNTWSHEVVLVFFIWKSFASRPNLRTWRVDSRTGGR